MKNENGTKSIVFTAGDSNKAVTLTDGKFSGRLLECDPNEKMGSTSNK